MKFTLTGRVRPDKVVSKDDSRPAMTNPYLRLRRGGAKGKGKVTGGLVEATDSYKLVRLPVEFDENDEPTEGALPAAMFTGKTYTMRVVDGAHVSVTSTEGNRTIERPQLNGSLFPDTDKLIEPVLENLGSVKVGLNAKYLYDLAQSMGCEQIVLCFHGTEGDVRPILVLPDASSVESIESEGPLGLLMPIRLRDIKKGA